MHLLILSHGTPSQHDKFKRTIDGLKYPVVGPTRRGYYIPDLSEIKIWDVRISKHCAKDFLQDLQCFKDEEFVKTDNFKSHMKTKLFMFLIKVVRKLLGMKTIEFDPKAGEKLYDGWYQNMLLGCLDDPENEHGELL